ncbi:MAG: hypothetical protein ACR2NZ_03835, partial [Rubripirellula sp.]
RKCLHFNPAVHPMRSFLGLFLGLLAGFVVVALVEGISSLIYSRPADLDFGDREAVRVFVSTLPAGAFLILLAAHVLGAFTAALTSVIIVGRRWIVGPLLLGFLLLIAGIVNLILIPHPAWFALGDIMVYLPSAIAGGIIGGKLVSWRRSVPDSTPSDIPTTA